MELTKEQIQEIEIYISSCGIKYYDVRAEIVDHFATVLEQQLEDNPTLDFKKEIRNVHRNFSDSGFYFLLKEKTKAVHKKFYISSLKHLLGFFKLPKILISIALFLGLKEIMKFMNDVELFFSGLTAIAFLIVISLFIKEYVNRKRKKENFLILNKNDSFLQLMNFLVILFNSSINFRSKASFENEMYNQIHIGVYVLLLLFYWSGEYIFRQNKENVLEQYPNVIV
jgi:hypothetical protein